MSAAGTACWFLRAGSIGCAGAVKLAAASLSLHDAAASCNDNDDAWTTGTGALVLPAL